MDNLLLHPASRRLIDAYLHRPTQSLLLSGPLGIGTQTTAKALATELRARPNDIHLIVPDDKQTISIDRIRELYILTRSIYDSPRAIIIDDSEAMSHAAQNALLKLLEEPNEQTYFILTSHQPQLLLATIRSRTQQIELRPTNEHETRNFLKSQHSSADDLSKMLFIATGLPAELTRLQHDRGYFQSQTGLMTAARGLLQAGLYDRLVQINEYKDRGSALGLVLAIGRLLEFSVRRQKRTDLAAPLELVETVFANLKANGNVRIQLIYLMTKLP